MQAPSPQFLSSQMFSKSCAVKNVVQVITHTARVVLECGFAIFRAGRGNVAGLVFKKLAGLRVAGCVLFSRVSRVNKIFNNQMYLFLSESILIYAKTREFKPATFLAGFDLCKTRRLRVSAGRGFSRVYALEHNPTQYIIFHLLWTLSDQFAITYIQNLHYVDIKFSVETVPHPLILTFFLCHKNILTKTGKN